MLPNPRQLILNLLLANEGAPLPVRAVVIAGALFGIRENSVRVALVRLGAEQLIEAAERGSYRLGPRAAPVAAEVSRWRSVEERLTSWDGGYVAVLLGALGREERRQRRERDRALALLGFRPLEPALYVRPDNLVGGVAALRQSLYSLGLDSGAPVFLASDFDSRRGVRLRSLWDSTALNAAYRATTATLQEWLARKHTLELDAAARESYLLGDRAIHQLVFDPLLPAPFVDEAARAAFIQAVRRFDRAGHDLWRRLYRSIAAGAPAAARFTRRTA